jgi:hypothetical protein
MLNRDVIHCILMNMGALDAIRARAVCKDWRTAYDKIYEMYAEDANRLLNTHCDVGPDVQRTSYVNLCKDAIYEIRWTEPSYDGEYILIERRTICPVLSIRINILRAYYDTFSALSALTLDSIPSGNYDFGCVVRIDGIIFNWTIMINNHSYIICELCDGAFSAGYDGEFILELVKYMLSPDIRAGVEIKRYCKHILDTISADLDYICDHIKSCNAWT